MATGRHYEDRVMFTLYRREASYGTLVSAWDTAGCSMRDFEGDSAHEEWADLVQDDAELAHGEEYPTTQEIVRQGLSWTYVEPRVKANTLAGLLGLALGSVFTLRDGSSGAYRHRLEPLPSGELVSMNGLTAHAGGLAYRYLGLKADGFTLKNDGAYLHLEVPLIGSGSRATTNDSFAAVVSEPWLRWGDCHVYLKLATTPLVYPSPLLQGASNLGGGTYDLSLRLRSLSLGHGHHLAQDSGYRAGSGAVRGQLEPTRRDTQISLTFDVDTAREADELAYYLDQQTLAIELNCAHGALIDAGDSTWTYGCILILPCVKVRTLPRGQQDELDTLTLEGVVHSDGVNFPLTAWVYNGVSDYLGGTLRQRYLRLYDQEGTPWYLYPSTSGSLIVDEHVPLGQSAVEGAYHWIDLTSPEGTPYKIYPVPNPGGEEVGAQLEVTPAAMELTGTGLGSIVINSPQSAAMLIDARGVEYYLTVSNEALILEDSPP
jgi:hypothetical protein